MTGEACKKIDLDDFKYHFEVLTELYGKQRERVRLYPYVPVSVSHPFQKTGTPVEHSVLYD